MAFSSASFGSALSVVGLPATIQQGGVGGGFALASTGLKIASKGLDSKIKKHQEIVTLPTATRDTVDRMVSKALADKQMSDAEFQLIMTEYSQRHVLKKALRANEFELTRQTSRPDIETLKKIFAARWKKSSEKKFCSRRKLEIRLEKVNAKFYFGVTSDVTTEHY